MSNLTVENEKDPRVIAIRNDSRVGLGSCTYIDESFDANELIESFDDEASYGDPVDTPEKAVAWARDFQKLKLCQATNASNGDKDCPLVAAYDAWVDGETS
jgi:hypothetical protein